MYNNNNNNNKRMETYSSTSCAESKAPATTCSMVQVVSTVRRDVPSGTKFANVTTFLDDNRLLLAVNVKCLVGDVLSCCCSHLGVQNGHLFGLALLSCSNLDETSTRMEYFFLDESKKLAKYASKSWRMPAGWGTSPENRPLLILHFRVRVYVDCVQIIRCPISQWHYYLQLRMNCLDQWSFPDCVSEERCWQSASLAFTADEKRRNGKREDVDKTENNHQMHSNFRPELYLPSWVVARWGPDYVRRNLPIIAVGNDDINGREAMIRFCREVSTSPYNVNCHLYGMRRRKVDKTDNSLMEISDHGLTLKYGMDRNNSRIFEWKNISKLSFDQRKVSLLEMNGYKVVLFAESDQKSRYLLQFCRSVHQQLLALQTGIERARSYPECRSFRESYVGDRPAPVASSTSQLIDHHRSTVSNGSSNTTSGIVSDRQMVHDDISELEQDPETVDCSPIVSELPLNCYHSSLDPSHSTPPIQKMPSIRKNSTDPSDNSITVGSEDDEQMRVNNEHFQDDGNGGKYQSNWKSRTDCNSASKFNPNYQSKRLSELAKSAGSLIARELSGLIGSDSSKHTRIQSSSCSSSLLKVNVSSIRQRTLHGYYPHNFPLKSMPVTCSSTQTDDQGRSIQNQMFRIVAKMPSYDTQTVSVQAVSDGYCLNLPAFHNDDHNQQGGKYLLNEPQPQPHHHHQQQQQLDSFCGLTRQPPIYSKAVLLCGQKIAPELTSDPVHCTVVDHFCHLNRQLLTEISPVHESRSEPRLDQCDRSEHSSCLFPDITIKQPPPYERAIQLQRKNTLERRRKNVDKEKLLDLRLRNCPMIRALMHENQLNGDMPSAKTTQEASRVLPQKTVHIDSCTTQGLVSTAASIPLYYPRPPPSPFFALRDPKLDNFLRSNGHVAIINDATIRCSTPNFGPPSLGIVELPAPPPYNPRTKPRNAKLVAPLR